MLGCKIPVIITLLIPIFKILRKLKMNCLQEIESEGFAIINSVFSVEEIENIIQEIDQSTLNKEKNESDRQTADLFAIRQFHKKNSQEYIASF